MRNMLVCLLLSLFALSAQTKAGILIEPYLGYSLAGSGDYTTSDKVEVDYSSLTLGGRLGYQFLGLMAGVDYSMQSFDADFELNGAVNKDGLDKKQLGIFVGYDFPILLRAWGTLFISGSSDGSDAAKSSGQTVNTNHKFKDGGGYALGVGFTGLPFLSINLEYRTMEYDTYEISGATVSNYNEKLNLSEIMLSVSAPFDFF